MEAEIAADVAATIEGALNDALSKEAGGADLLRVLIL